jgi:hypothetical protein
MAAVMTAVEWAKTGRLTLTPEAVVGFIVVGLMYAIQARSEWNKFASIYPDIGIEHDRAGR